jgi:cytochrome c-type biogenesis protein
VIAALPASLLAAVPVAFVAGLVSFLSPCVLPLVPGYLGFLGGAAGGRARTVLGSLAFVGGFSVVFVSSGAVFSSLGHIFRSHERGISIAGGIVTIVLGVTFAGWLNLPFLQRERRSHLVPSATVGGAVVLGFLFGLGWTPCIGPTLASILTLSASTGATAWRGSILTLVYCVGLGLPFVVAASASEWALRALQVLRRRTRTVTIIGGVILVAVGVAEVTGWWLSWVHQLQSWVPSVTPSI